MDKFYAILICIAFFAVIFLIRYLMRKGVNAVTTLAVEKVFYKPECEEGRLLVKEQVVFETSASISDVKHELERYISLADQIPAIAAAYYLKSSSSDRMVFAFGSKLLEQFDAAVLFTKSQQYTVCTFAFLTWHETNGLINAMESMKKLKKQVKYAFQAADSPAKNLEGSGGYSLSNKDASTNNSANILEGSLSARQAISQNASSVTGTDIGNRQNKVSPATNRTPKPASNDFFVKNYFPGLPIQAIKLHLTSQADNNVLVSVDFYCYLNSNIQAVNVDIEFISVFGDRLVFSDIPFTDLTAEDALLYSDEQPVEMDIYKISSIGKVNIQIKKFISEGKVISNTTRSRDISLSDKELSDLKFMAGINAITIPAETSEGWTCTCGTDNEPDITACQLCMKARNTNSDLGVGALSSMVEKMKVMNSAREMTQFLSEYCKNNSSEQLAELLQKLQTTAQVERMYGNQRIDALKILRQSFPVN